MEPIATLQEQFLARFVSMYGYRPKWVTPDQFASEDWLRSQMVLMDEEELKREEQRTMMINLRQKCKETPMKRRKLLDFFWDL